MDTGYESFAQFYDRLTNNVDYDAIAQLVHGLVQKHADYKESVLDLACGTGACATVTAAVTNGICPVNEDVRVHLRGGVLTIKYTGERVLMTGPAEFVFDGTVEN